MYTLGERLKIALDGPPKKSQAALARACGLKAPSVHDWLSGKTKTIEGKNLLCAAKFLEVDPVWLAYGKGSATPQTKTLRVAESVAPYNATPESQAFRMAPVISWIQAGSWCDANDPFVPGDAEEWLPVPVPGKASLNTYALRVRGISMEPEYQDGDVIFVDPNRTPEHGKHVVVRLDEQNEATFKQLIMEGDKRYLKPLNPDWPEKIIPVSADSTICGVVIGKWVDK